MAEFIFFTEMDGMTSSTENNKTTPTTNRMTSHDKKDNDDWSILDKQRHESQCTLMSINEYCLMEIRRYLHIIDKLQLNKAIGENIVSDIKCVHKAIPTKDTSKLVEWTTKYNKNGTIQTTAYDDTTWNCGVCKISTSNYCTNEQTFIKTIFDSFSRTNINNEEYIITSSNEMTSFINKEIKKQHTVVQEIIEWMKNKQSIHGFPWIIAGGFASYINNATSYYTDIDLFTNKIYIIEEKLENITREQYQMKVFDNHMKKLKNEIEELKTKINEETKKVNNTNKPYSSLKHTINKIKRDIREKEETYNALLLTTINKEEETNIEVIRNIRQHYGNNENKRSYEIKNQTKKLMDIVYIKEENIPIKISNNERALLYIHDVLTSFDIKECKHAIWWEHTTNKWIQITKTTSNPTVYTKESAEREEKYKIRENNVKSKDYSSISSRIKENNEKQQQYKPWRTKYRNNIIKTQI